jgi:hypothetical protein
MDFGFLNKQVNKITSTDELSILYFKLKKLQIIRHNEFNKKAKEHQEINNKISVIMEKVVMRIVEMIDIHKEVFIDEAFIEEESTDEDEEEDEEQLKSGDIELLSEDSDSE